jgi:hypothetical protein
MGRQRNPLSLAFALLLSWRRPSDHAVLNVGLGWKFSTGYGDELVWKDGATAGYSSFMGYSTRSRRATVVLANGQCSNILTAIGKRALNADFPAPG